MANTAGTPVLLILPGATSNRERRETLWRNGAEAWPGARIEVPDYLSRFRGVRGVGLWLERWVQANLTADEQVFVFAFILGAAALPYAPTLVAHMRRLVVLRSRYQEALPRFLRRRFTPPGAALIAGRAVSDLGRPPFWPPRFAPPCPTLTVVETRPTRTVERLGLKALSDSELGIHDAVEAPLDHDGAYFSTGLMRTAVEWLRTQE
jgi:hypothetical protein